MRARSAWARPLKPITHPLRREIPIFLGAEGPKNVTQTAEIADGWLPLYYSPYRQEVYADQLAGAKDGFEITAMATMVVTDDIEAGLAPVKAMLGFYIGGMGAKGQNYHTKLMQRMGYEAEALKVQELFFEGRRDEAIAAVPERLRRRDQPGRPHRAHPGPGGGLGGQPGDHDPGARWQRRGPAPRRRGRAG